MSAFEAAPGSVTAAFEKLCSEGMSEANAVNKGPRYARCDAALNAVRAPAQRVSLWVPGRIELFGKHTDYAGGRSLLAAVERGFCVRLSARPDAVIRVIDVGRNEQCETRFGTGVTGSRNDWSNYVATVARRIARDFPGARAGVDIAFSSDLPTAAGLSSSSVLVVAVALAVIEANQLAGTADYAELFPSRADLAAYLGAVESGSSFGRLKGDAGVGTFGGSEDHVAALCCEAGRVSQFAFAPVRAEGEWTLAPAFTLVVGVSGVSANKGGSARERYNRTSRMVSSLLERWNRETSRADGSLAAAIGSSADAAHRLAAMAERPATAEFTGSALRNRLSQFIEESYTIVPAAAVALSHGDFGELGMLADRSHRLAETSLGNQVPETSALQRLAREAGASAASAFGAGFGGSVWAIVPTAGADAFVERWAAAYAAAYPPLAARSTFFISPPGPHAIQW